MPITEGVSRVLPGSSSGSCAQAWAMTRSAVLRSDSYATLISTTASVHPRL